MTDIHLTNIQHNCSPLKYEHFSGGSDAEFDTQYVCMYVCVHIHSVYVYMYTFVEIFICMDV